MKTIFLSVFQASTVKNLLRTGVVNHLVKHPDVQVVCLVPHEERAEYYETQVSHPRLIYEVCKPYTKGVVDRVFDFLKFRLIRTATQEMRIRRLKLANPNHNRFVVFSGALFDWAVARPSVRRVARFLDYHLVKNRDLDPIFNRYRPDTIVLPQLFEDYDIALLRAAKKKGVTTIGYINSWDKLTTRCALRLLPDKLIVFNDIIKQEAILHADIRPDQVVVCGIPQYDQYITDTPNAREEFFKPYSFDPKKKLVVYAPIGRSFSDSDWYMLDRLHELRDEGAFKYPIEILVRFQPNDFLDEPEMKRRPWMRYDKPGIRYGRKRGTDWDMTFADLKHLTNTLAHAAVVVCYASSLSVDAAVMGKPVININFEPAHKPRGSRSPLVYYETEHYRKALAPGGIRLVGSERELVEWIKRYLEDPSLDSEGRRRLVEQQCFRADGKASERVAKVILD